MGIDIPMYCGYCGKNNLDDHNYCVGCGQRLEALPEIRIQSKNGKHPGSVEDPLQGALTQITDGEFSTLNLLLPEEGLDLAQTLVDLEKAIVLDTLKRVRGVKSAAAGLLGLNRTTLVEKLKRLELDGQSHDVIKLDPETKPIVLQQVLRDVQVSLILAALNRVGWNVSKAAGLLGLNRTTLTEKMKRYEIAQK